MQYYLAPLEGITGYVYRNAYNKYFEPMDKYFTPFIQHKGFSSKELNDILPENNKGINLVPQILTNDVDTYKAITEKLRFYGYDTVNINLGCPYGTVVSKKHGAGFLSVPDKLDEFLYEIFSLGNMKISVKTRIGMSDYSEWPGILDIYNKYELEELIIHPRLRDDLYKKDINYDAFDYAAKNSSVSLCYNGDIVAKADYDRIVERFPSIDSVMMGRGILKNPDLVGTIKGGKSGIMKDFLQELADNYVVAMSGENNALYKLKELWSHLGESYPDKAKALKKIKKASRMSEYNIAVREVLD